MHAQATSEHRRQSIMIERLEARICLSGAGDLLHSTSTFPVAGYGFEATPIGPSAIANTLLTTVGNLRWAD